MSVNWADLAAPFPPTDIEWRIGQAGVKDGKPWAKVLAYITNRAIMDRLDAVVGPANWQNEFRPWTVGDQHGVICRLNLRVDHEWIAREDGAENTDIESIKGGLSGAMKRAAVQWGIGRYLYDLPEGWAKVSPTKQPGYHYQSANKAKEMPAFYWTPPELPKWALPTVPKAS